MNPYQVFSVVSLEQPTYQKWNYLGTNDAYFNQALVDGWVSAVEETWTYAAADSPTFTYTISGDKTTKYQAGQRIRIKQGGGYKYFIITAVSYSAPNTTVTIYGGTDYTLTNVAITDNWFSVVKAPFGFPMDPTKWSVEVTNTADNSQASPVASTWYNLGSVSINIPIGAWNVFVKATATVTRASGGSLVVSTTLSTANNSASDPNLTNFWQTSADTTLSGTAEVSKRIVTVAKTPYYLNTSAGNSSATNIYNENSRAKMVITAVCAYL